MILVDTNVLSELTRPEPATRVVAWLDVNEPALAVPAIALAELRYGIARLPQGRRRSSLLRFWQRHAISSEAGSSRSIAAPPRCTETWQPPRSGRADDSTSRTRRTQRPH